MERELLKHIQNSTKTEIFDFITDSIGGDVADAVFPGDVSLASAKYLNEFQKDFLPEACSRGDKDVVLALLSCGANPFSKGSKVNVISDEHMYWWSV